MNGASLAACLLAFIVSTAAAVPTAVVDLRANPDHALRGLPTMLKIAITNTGSETIVLKGTARMFGSDPTGTSFLAIGNQENPNVGVFALWDDPSLTIPPGTKRLFYWRTTERSNVPVFFGDAHFQKAGRFLLRLELLTSDRNVTLTSNDASFTVDEPRGIDATVWNLVVAAGGLRAPPGVAIAGVGEKIAPMVLSQFASSNYAPHLVPLLKTRSEIFQQNLYLWALTQTVPDSFAAELNVIVLRMYVVGTGNGLGRFDLASALTYQSKAQRLAEQLKNSGFPFVAEAAVAALADLPTPEQLRMQFSAHLEELPPTPASVSPFVQCVDLGAKKDDDLFVVFGYTNPNQFGKYLPPGSENRVQPGGDDTVLPRFFGPGTRKNALMLVGNGTGPVTWSLDGHSATASTKSEQCAPPPTPVPVTPVLDCVQGDDDNLTASFGYVSNNAVPIRVERGPSNTATAGVGTPTIFLPGEHHAVVTVRSKRGEKPAWTLQGTTVAASASALPCRTGDDNQQSDH